MGAIGVKRPDLAEINRRRARHNMEGTTTYKTWRAMRSRCENESDKDYKHYGARGIRVCEKWGDFCGFLEDMGIRPDGTTIGRIDNNGNYEPENCRWETTKQQGRNKRSNVVITFNGKSQCIAEWAEETGIERKTLEYRIRAGWDVDRALTTKSLIKRK